MALLDDWKAALVDGSDIDPFEFSTLIPLDASETYLHDAFGTLPNAHKMIEKIRVLLAENATGGAYVIPRAENAIGEKACIELANAYRLEIRTFLSASGKEDLAKDLDGDNIILIHDIAEFNSLSTSPNYTHLEAKNEMSFMFADRFAAFDDWIYALEEAVLGLTKYPELTRYILSDVVGFQYNSPTYYTLWKGGGDANFFAGGMFVLDYKP